MAQQPAFGRRLKRLRQANRMSQRDLAGEKVTASYVSLLEAGSRVPTLDVVVHLANTLGVTVTDLLGQDIHPPSPGNRFEESLLLADRLMSDAADANDYLRAAETLQAAFDRARQQGNDLRALEIGVRLQQVLAVINRSADRVSLIQQILGLPGACASPDLRVVLSSDLAAALRQAGRLPEAVAAAQSALEAGLPPALRGGAEHVKLLGVLTSVLVELGEADRAETHVLEMLRVARSAGAPGLQGRAHWVATNAYSRMGRHDLARHHLTQAHRALAAPTMPLREWLRFCRSSAAVLLEAGDDLDEVEIWLTNAATSARMLGLPGERKRVEALHARMQLAKGELEECLQGVAEVLADSAGMSVVDLIRLRLVQAEALFRLDRRAEAEALYHSLASRAEEVGAQRLAADIWRRLESLPVGGPTQHHRMPSQLADPQPRPTVVS
ncbi:helix-turn-helix domain-containing protein [Micromonospora arida]|uniref:helix-turn-helix domain-containing protein n=1 Tax=Micromonospora arida TaxID=2203715 RepID=UPI0024486B34|nr:helix-turn-helix domain-containing protein [Micromonospora arida]